MSVVEGCLDMSWRCQVELLQKMPRQKPEGWSQESRCKNPPCGTGKNVCYHRAKVNLSSAGSSEGPGTIYLKVFPSKGPGGWKSILPISMSLADDVSQEDGLTLPPCPAFVDLEKSSPGECQVNVTAMCDK